MKANVISFENNREGNFMPYFKIRFENKKETKILNIDTNAWYYKRKEIKQYIKENWEKIQSFY